MPINPNILPSPEPDESPDAVAPDGTELGQSGGAAEPPKRKRRTKAEMMADAVVPADDEAVLIEDIITGAKIERPWLVALEMVRDKKAKFADKAMNYAMAKYDEQKTSGDPASPETDAFGRPSPEQLEVAQLPTDASGQMLAPDGAEHGDEVIVGSKTYFVGPGGVLVDGVVDAPAKRRWQRQLGTGSNGPWEKIALRHDEPEEPSVPVEQNGKGDLDVQHERIPHTVDEIAPGTFKVGTGMLEKIGLPNYSSLQIGPLTLSRTIQDDGQRTKATVNGREMMVITSVVEAFEEMDDTLEFISARFRGQLQSFLEATGALNQPVA